MEARQIPERAGPEAVWRMFVQVRESGETEVNPVRIGDATLYLGDCMDVLPTLGKVDAVVTDPPYGMNYDTDSTRFGGKTWVRFEQRGQGRSDREIHGDDEPFDPAPWLNYSSVVLFGANHFSQRLPVGSTLIWLKRSMQHYGTFLSDAEVAWEKGGHGVYVFFAEDSNGRRRKEATGKAFGSETAHPSQKPIALMHWCLQRNPAQVTLDPYMGSGTTGVACRHLGRAFIGIEREPRYFDIACKRIEAAYAQGRLFEEPKPDPEQAQIFGDAA